MENLTIEKFVFEIPLYDSLKWANEKVVIDEDGEAETIIENAEGNLVENIICFKGKLDGPCITCGKDTTYSRIDTPLASYEVGNISRSPFIMRMVFDCGRNTNHQIEILIKIFPNENAFLKIGQFPSIATLTKGEINKYRKVLGEKFNEFSKGIGLISHGVGIGSFVYLRRVFETLIENAHTLAKSSQDWSEELYLKAKMDQKIELLKSYLPAFLVKNKILYGILSKGIHELTEQECLEIFPVVKLGIELILNDEIKRREEIETIKIGENLIKNIAHNLKK